MCYRLDEGFSIEVDDEEYRVEVRGDLDAHTSPRLRRAIEHLLKGAPGTVVIDLTQATFVEPTAVDILINGARLAERDDVALVIDSPNSEVYGVLERTGASGAIAIRNVPRPAP